MSIAVEHRPMKLNATLACLGLLSCATASAAETLTDALTGGKSSGQLRYRYEWVDDATKTQQAGASTLRTQLGYLTGDYLNLAALLQFENVQVIGSERYNNGINGLTQYPTVSDPAGTEINQAFLSYKGLPATVVKYGRQLITLDNQRFIGAVDWRQNQQTFDAFSLSNTSLPDTSVFYAHVTNADRIFSAASTQGRLHMSSDLLNVAYKGFKPGTVVAYGYLLDYATGQPIANTLSNKTLGLRFDGGYTPADMATKFLYTAEYARQSSYADGASTVDGTYNYLMLGADLSGIQIKLHYELLSGDGTYGFATPLATLHAFNGWADKFLATPKDGLKDMFITAGMPVAGINLLAAYHRYSADNQGYDYGSELNLSATKKLDKMLAMTLKYASYSGDSNSTNLASNPTTLAKDMDKLWLQADVQF